MKKTILLAFAAAACLGLLLACPTETTVEKKYTVIFDKNNDDVTGASTPNPETKRVKANAAVGKLPELTSTSHTFTGWNTDPDGDGKSFTETTKVTKSITVYAQWTKVVPIIVTFDKNNTTEGGTNASPTTRTVNPETKKISALPTVPRRPGYEFNKWTKDQAGNGEAFTAETVNTETASFTVYAQWSDLPPWNAGQPTISEQPVGTRFILRDLDGTPTVTPAKGLSVTAALPSGESPAGSLSYQWYYSTVSPTDTGTAIQGATSDTYDPASVDLSALTTTRYYYVKVTNTNNNATGGTKTAFIDSSRAAITVKDGNNVELNYTVSGSGASLSATGGTLTSAAGTMTQVLTAIRTDAAGKNVEITFTTSGAVTDTADFSGNDWGAITLKGGISSDLTGDGIGTVTINDTSVQILGSIGNTNDTASEDVTGAGKAVYISGSSSVEVADGAALTADAGNALYHAGSGTVIISGGTLTSANNTSSGTSLTRSVGTVCCSGPNANLTISGGTVINTATGNGFGVWMNSGGDTTTTMLTISGGTIDIKTIRAVAIIWNTSVTLKGTGPAIPTGLIYISNGAPNPWTDGKIIIGSNFAPGSTVFPIGFNAGVQPADGRVIVEGGATYKDNFSKVVGPPAEGVPFTVTGNDLTY